MIQDEQMIIGKVVRRLRKKAKMTQPDLADRISGYDSANLSRFETGKQAIDEAKLLKIAKILGINPNPRYSHH